MELRLRANPRGDGRTATWRQADVTMRGHAKECRINAEDPVSFMRSRGTVIRFDMPGGPGVRVDTHMRAGATVPTSYDAMVAKLITHGADRAEAIRRVEIALSETVVGGVRTNVDLHRAILQDPAVVSGGATTHHLGNLLRQRQART